jgi:hypothetical protein
MTMNKKSTSRLLSLFALALLLTTVFAAQASAAPKDRNHNAIPDAWEKAHGISVKKDRGNHDADGDGSRNRCEFQAKTDPNIADSDGDTIADGDEDTDGDGATDRAESSLRSSCGKANTHLQLRRGTVNSLTDGSLVITVKGGGTVTAPLSAKLRCEIKPGKLGAKKNASVAGANKRAAKRCTEADLVEGVKVHNARTKGGKFVAITIIK